MQAQSTRYFLPVSHGERTSWLPEIPEELKSANSDYVSFRAVGSSTPKEVTNENAACYSWLDRSKLDEYSIHCCPKQKPRALSLEDVQTFFAIMTEHHIIPEGIQLWEEEDGIHCQVPEQAGPAANVYAALACYRWVDAHPPLVWEFLRILEQGVPRHPLQILPYLINRHVSNCNHSFITTSGWKAQLPEFEKATNPTLGLAARIVFDRGDLRGEKVFTQAGAHCNTTIGKVSREIAPRTLVKTSSEWGPPRREAPLYILQKPEDGLHPDLYQLYTLPNITAEQIEEVFSALFTEKEA